MVTEFVAAAKKLEGELIAQRRDFHRHPELGYQEVRTSAIVANQLSDLGIEVQTGVDVSLSLCRCFPCGA